jgi:2',3'-cyclic-nucleotide 2'-phosphodiesterase
MNLLYLGDIVGRAAREKVCDELPRLRERLALDFIAVNGENAAGGFGINNEICTQLFAAGADVILTGNHVWDQKEIIARFPQETRLLRPANFPAAAPGRGSGVYLAAGGLRVMVVQVMGRLFMEPLDDPFAAADQAIRGAVLGRDVACILVDVHGEATSEKMAIGHYLDGRVTAVVGTHTHVPTADLQTLPGGTLYMSDIGMCGDYDSVIGMDKAEPVRRFTTKVPGGKWQPALGEPTLCGVFLDIDEQTGWARRAAPLRLGGRLSQAWPT